MTKQINTEMRIRCSTDLLLARIDDLRAQVTGLDPSSFFRADREALNRTFWAINDNLKVAMDTFEYCTVVQQLGPLEQLKPPGGRNDQA